IRLEGECKTDFGTKIISSEHAQPDHRQSPVKRRVETVHGPRCGLNPRGFKRLGDPFHLQQTLWFREPPNVTVAIAVCQQPHDACLDVEIFSHGTLHYYTARAIGKSLICRQAICNRIVKIWSDELVEIPLHSGRTDLRYRI